MKKRFLSLTLAAAMVMSLAGCRSAEPAATTAAPASEATTAAPADGEKKEGPQKQKQHRQEILRLVLLPVRPPRVMRRSLRQIR